MLVADAILATPAQVSLKIKKKPKKKKGERRKNRGWGPKRSEIKGLVHKFKLEWTKLGGRYQNLQ